LKALDAGRERGVCLRVARALFGHGPRNPTHRRALRRDEAEKNDMLRVFTVPLAIRTPVGRVFARYAFEPGEVGEPWWIIYRGDCGRWFTAMLPNLEPAG
jgi:hypothetical protein